MTSRSEFCRWGILGAAFIARKNWQALRDAGNARLVAVASRDLERARIFIDECQASAPLLAPPEAMDSYEALLARPDIDAVYIPLPTGLRREWVLRAAAAGKHVLAEKPIGRDAAEVAELIAACQRQGVQFMDGVMFMHGARLRRLQEVIRAEVGPVRQVSSQFSFRGDEAFLHSNIRAQGDLEPLGCLGDLGWYCLRFTLWACEWAEPLRVSGRLHRATADGVPLEFSGALDFADGVSASFHCSFTAAHAQWAVVSGEQGLLRLDDFVLPYAGEAPRYSVTHSEFVLDGCRADMRAGRSESTVDEPANNAPGSQESGMFRTFSSLVLEGRRDTYWPRISLLTQRVLDACLASARAGGVWRGLA
jgi:predicted dehydrogenase